MRYRTVWATWFFSLPGITTGAFGLITECCTSIMRSDTPLTDRVIFLGFSGLILYGAGFITSAIALACLVKALLSPRPWQAKLIALLGFGLGCLGLLSYYLLHSK